VAVGIEDTGPMVIFDGVAGLDLGWRLRGGLTFLSLLCMGVGVIYFLFLEG